MHIGISNSQIDDSFKLMRFDLLVEWHNEPLLAMNCRGFVTLKRQEAIICTHKLNWCTKLPWKCTSFAKVKTQQRSNSSKWLMQSIAFQSNSINSIINYHNCIFCNWLCSMNSASMQQKTIIYAAEPITGFQCSSIDYYSLESSNWVRFFDIKFWLVAEWFH